MLYSSGKGDHGEVPDRDAVAAGEPFGEISGLPAVMHSHLVRSGKVLGAIVLLDGKSGRKASPVNGHQVEGNRGSTTRLSNQ